MTVTDLQFFLQTYFRLRETTLVLILTKDWINHAVSSSTLTGRDAAEIFLLRLITYKVLNSFILKMPQIEFCGIFFAQISAKEIYINKTIL